MKNQKKSMSQVSLSKGKFLPQEEKLEVGGKEKKLIIGVPRDKTLYENRVALAPHAVELLVNNGNKVIVESKAGEGAHFDDVIYSEAGAVIVDNFAEVFMSDVVVKVAPFTDDEIKLMHRNQIIISSLNAANEDKNYITKLISKKTTAIAFEYIKDTDNNSYPIVCSMSEISGTTSILIAAEYLSNVNNGKGEMLGGIAGVSPSDVVIIGAGTAGEFAAKTALALGATVKVFDTSISSLRKLQNNLGSRVFTSILQPKVLLKAMKTADVAIGALYSITGEKKFIVTEDIIKEMKRGSVIVDISIDHGGCFETSRVTNHKNSIFTKYGVVHYCVPNIPSRVARTASYALSNIFGSILMSISEAGGIKQVVKNNLGLRNGVYVFNGILTKQEMGDKFNLPSRDIDLLLAAF
ncbi:MAG: alanine dehydrogenase [Bacteroidales bacterium]|nr:alanine dehydrogenase [Bacteroidales bacterium]